MAETGRLGEEAADQEVKREFGIDLDNLSIAQLTALRDGAEAKRREQVEKAENAALSEFRAKLESLGLSVDEVLARAGLRSAEQAQAPRQKKRTDAGQKISVVYREPGGTRTWPKRGRPPDWLKKLEAAGHNREEFRVEVCSGISPGSA
jgi:DNA-binding protein H-NS